MEMPHSRIEEALLVAALYRGRHPSERLWSSNCDQVLTLSLYFSADISRDDCVTRFAQRPYLQGIYDDDGRINERIRQRYGVLIDLIQRHSDLIEGGGDLKTPADPTYTACGLTPAGRQLAAELVSTFPKKPEFPNWPERGASTDDE